MSQRKFFTLWWLLRPRDFSRAKWFRLGLVGYESAAALGMPFRHPRLWWFCRRLSLHQRFGLPRPLCDRERGILRA